MKEIDFVLLDGAENADQTLNELNMFDKRLRTGSIVACHDWKKGKADKIRPVFLDRNKWKTHTIITDTPTGFAMFERI